MCASFILRSSLLQSQIFYAGELDFQADEAFLEALMTFALSVPTADIFQDAAWEARQRRLLTAQFGPNEVGYVGDPHC